MLSKRITENKRLLTAAPAIKQRIITRSRPRVFRPVACFKNWLSSAAAIFRSKGCAERVVLVARPRHGASTQAIIEHTLRHCSSALYFADELLPPGYCNTLYTPAFDMIVWTIRVQTTLFGIEYTSIKVEIATSMGITCNRNDSAAISTRTQATCIHHVFIHITALFA